MGKWVRHGDVVQRDACMCYRTRSSFHSDGFGQIPGFIHITAPGQGGIIGEDLQGNDVQAGLQQGVGLWNGEHVIRRFPGFLSHGLQGQAQDLCPPGLDLPDVGHGLVEEAGDGGHCNHQGARLNEGNGTMLQFSGGVGLGVDVGDFL